MSAFLPRFFATTETVRIYLFPETGNSPGVWVEVKKYLSYGETRRLATAALQSMTREEVEANAGNQNKFWLDFEKQDMFKLALHVVDWNLWDHTGKKVELPLGIHERIEVMRNLSPEIGEAISKEIDRIKEADARLELAQGEEILTGSEVDRSDPLPSNVLAFEQK